MRVKHLFIFTLLASLLFACISRSKTEIRIRKGKKHQQNNDCPGLDCGHAGKRK